MDKLNSGAHVVFVCAGNHTRSPLAAAIFAEQMKLRGLDCVVESAGYLDIMAGEPATSRWAGIPGANRYDLSAHRGRHISSVEYTQDTLFICLDDLVVEEMLCLPGINRENVRLIKEPEGVPDPTMKGADAYEYCFMVMQRCIKGLAARLAEA